MLKPNHLKLLILFIIGLIGLGFISLNLGPSGLNLFELFNSTSEIDRAILFDIRVPRTMLAIFVGATLAGSGLLLQSLLQNPLGEPYTLGLSGGASLGAVLFIALGFESEFVALGSFVGCWIVTFIILKVQKIFLNSPKTLVLFGVMISFLCGAVVTLLITLLDPNNIQSAIFWLVGQVSENGKLWPLSSLTFLITLLFVLYNHRSLDLFLIDSRATPTISSKINSIRIFVILLVSMMTSVAVYLSGLIGFVGLIAPHIAKMYFKSSRHLISFIFSALFGAMFMLLADILARAIGGSIDIPAGGITAIVGAPFFIYIIFTRMKNA